jgi:nucleotide-binding universal stress UspA family protein
MSPAATSPPTATATRRVLVVVDDTCTAPAVCASVRAFAADDPLEALVIAPGHGAADAQWYVDEDAARAEATHRLRICLSCLSRDGIRVSGHLGDADPVQAITDALHAFAADEILLVTARDRPSRWLRPSVLERVRRTVTQPVRHVAMLPKTGA